MVRHAMSFCIISPMLLLLLLAFLKACDFCTCINYGVIIIAKVEAPLHVDDNNITWLDFKWPFWIMKRIFKLSFFHQCHFCANIWCIDIPSNQMVWMNEKKETEEKKVENWVRMKLLIFYNEINIDVKLFLFHYHGNFSFFAGCRRTFLKRKRWMRLTPNKYTA